MDNKKKLQTPEKRDEMKERNLPTPRGILLVGVPGCGKSLSAKAIAANWQLPLYRLDFATLQGSFVGQSEKQLKERYQQQSMYLHAYRGSMKLKKDFRVPAAATMAGYQKGWLGSSFFGCRSARSLFL